jgi:hypothetical protein
MLSPYFQQQQQQHHQQQQQQQASMVQAAAAMVAAAGHGIHSLALPNGWQSTAGAGAGIDTAAVALQQALSAQLSTRSTRE